MANIRLVLKKPVEPFIQYNQEQEELSKNLKFTAEFDSVECLRFCVLLGRCLPELLNPPREIRFGKVECAEEIV